MLLEIDLLTLSMGVRLKLPPFINPLCGQMDRSCPENFKKIAHIYVSLIVLKISFITLLWVWG